MKKTITDALLTACMILCGFAATMPANYNRTQAETFKLFVNGTNVLEAENYTVECGDGTAYYDADSLTLTLDNATITNRYSYSGVYISGAPDAFTVKIKGKNLIDFSAEDKSIYAVRSFDTSLLVVKGDDPENDVLKTVIYAKNGTTDSPHSIMSRGDIVIDGVSLDFSLTEGSRIEGVSITSDGGETGNITIKNSSVKITDYLNGIFTFAGDVTIENSTVNIDAKEVAIYTDYDLIASGGDITLSSHDTEYETPAICIYHVLCEKRRKS